MAKINVSDLVEMVIDFDQKEVRDPIDYKNTSFWALYEAFPLYGKPTPNYSGELPDGKSFDLFVKDGHVAIKMFDAYIGDLPLYQQQEDLIQHAYNDYIGKLNEKLGTKFELVASTSCFGTCEMAWACPLNEAEKLISHLFETEGDMYNDGISDELYKLISDLAILAGEDDYDYLTKEERNEILVRCGYSLEEIA